VRSDAVRWSLCAAIVAAAHGFAWVALATSRSPVASDAGSPVVTLELSPVAAAPAPPDEPQADAEPDAQAAQAEPVAEAAPAAEPLPSPPPPTPEPTPMLAVNEPPPPTPLLATPPAVSQPVPPPPPISQPVEQEAPTVVDLPPPTRQPAARTPPAIVDPTPQPPSPPPSASSVASMTTADIASAPVEAPGREEADSPAALRTWRQALIAQIERHKQFPKSAQGQSGVSSVAFTIDRDGRLTEVRLVASSGSPALDQASLDLIRRAEPFPAPPAGLAANDLSFVAPIRYLPSPAR
jgi:periplasmic protein TonB